MKNPLPLTNSWTGSADKDPVLVTVPAVNKKFKRKSREPKRLFSVPENDGIKGFSVDDVDMVEDRGPVQKQLMFDSTVPGLKEDILSSTQNDALDMRISSRVPSLASSGFSSPEISHWTPSISQPLSHRLRLGLQPPFPLSPRHQVFSVESSVQGQSVPTAPQSSQSQDHEETRDPSPKESNRKRLSLSSDGPGRLPEVKAIQQTRRLLANARERTRVHTISAAFEALRKQVPCYSYGQKLSKLAILRIACNYILSLAQLAELDYSSDHSSLTFSQCVEQCTRTLQAEGRSKKRKVGRIPEDV
ncbi:transcription factor atoh8 [Pholidichthys leucotaenia]